MPCLDTDHAKSCMAMSHRDHLLHVQVAVSSCSPPTTVVAPAAVAWPMARATAWVPAANPGTSKRPMGPFQNSVLQPRMASVNSWQVFGPMSNPKQPVASAQQVQSLLVKAAHAKCRLISPEGWSCSPIPQSQGTCSRQQNRQGHSADARSLIEHCLACSVTVQSLTASHSASVAPMSTQSYTQPPAKGPALPDLQARMGCLGCSSQAPQAQCSSPHHHPGCVPPPHPQAAPAAHHAAWPADASGCRAAQGARGATRCVGSVCGKIRSICVEQVRTRVAR